MSRRPLQLPISLAVIMLVLLALIIVGFVVIPLIPPGPLYYTLLVLGLVFLGIVVAGVVAYLTLTIKAINLNRRQSNFIDSVTHELKSPIASLKLYLQTLARRPVSPEEQADFYKFMLADVERLDLLINHILSAARLDKVDLAERAERIDIAELLRNISNQVCGLHRTPISCINFELADCTVFASRMDLALIFSNLVDNAVKYANSDSPQCWVSTEYLADRGAVVVRIRDNGPGIPNNFHHKVFGRFVRLGTELERKKPGTGLGLYIVRTLVKRCKGKVKIKSSKNKGTTFEVTLPNATALAPRNNAETSLSNTATDESGESDSPQSIQPNHTPNHASKSDTRIGSNETGERAS